MSQKKIVAFDTETFLFGPYEMAPRIVCLSCAWDNKTMLVHGFHDIERWLHGQLDLAIKGEILLVGHVVAYDTSCVLRSFPSVWNKVWQAYEANGITCTSIRERLINIAMDEFHYYYDNHGKKNKTDYSLAGISKRWFDEHIEKEDSWRLRYGELYNVPKDQWPKEAVDYALTDAHMTLRMYLQQERRAHTMGYNLPTQFEDSRADFALRLASVWGIEPDRERVSKAWNETIDRMDELVPSLLDGGLAEHKTKKQNTDLFTGVDAQRKPPEIKKNLNSICDAIVQHWPGGYLGDVPRTEKGAVKTGAEIIRRCLQFEPLQNLVEYNELQKLASTYLSKLFEPIIHARFYAVGAESDRTSCSSPNLQNQVEESRTCFRARPGTVFLASDFDSQEMRTLAQSCIDICGKSRLAERFQKNRSFDPHLEFAANLANISIKEAQKELEAEDARITSLRQQSKVANFGFPGGMGYESFVQYAHGWGLKDLTEARARELKNAWFEQWPEMRTYFNHVSTAIGEENIGTTIIPQSGFRRAGCGFTDACNSYFQTLAAHASKDAMFQVSKKCYVDRDSYLYGSRPVLFIHDEIIVEVPEEASDLAAQEMQGVLITSMEHWTPNVPAAASATLMRYWSKKAKRTFDERGRLIPCD